MRKVRIFYDPECRTTICSRSCRTMATHINSIRTRGEGGQTTKKTIFKLNLGKNIVINVICSDIRPMFQQPVTPRVWRDEYKWASQDNTHHTIILGDDAKEYFPTPVKLGIWQTMDSDRAKLAKYVLSGKYTIFGATWTNSNIDNLLEYIEELFKR